MANAYSSNGPADRSYVKKAMKAPMLEAEHELELARRWREEEDEKALHELTRAYLRLSSRWHQNSATMACPCQISSRKGMLA